VPTKRSYNDGCAVAHALDLFSEHWALLLVRELVDPKRFTDLYRQACRTSALVHLPSG
jgi:DNA-binding HxlR family transcriptional regulator